MTESKYELVFVRHGESEWNKSQTVGGWYDSALTEHGRQQCRETGKALQAAGYKFDVAFCSKLTRAFDTLNIILQEMNCVNIPVLRSWKLNESHSGGLTGMKKRQVVEKYGLAKARHYLYDYNPQRPPMESDHPFYKQIVLDPRYAEDLPPDKFPKYESFKMNMERTVPYFIRNIVPQVKMGRRVVVVSHHNTLKGLIKHLEQKTHDEIKELYIRNASPFTYKLDKDMKPTGPFKYIFCPKPSNKNSPKIV